ncbi:S41 family peptidase [Patescibacteria group bacterium]|nr:S41 family peptidase [Patescibacteria group bacterium]MBU2259018.1 S41 family peptidase [Patescibacteria group bacterium]
MSSPYPMSTYSRLAKILVLSVFCITVTVPQNVGAASVASTLIVPDALPVTRGDFVRAAVKVLKMRVGNGQSTMPYVRVPQALKPYIETAHSKGALEMFTNDLQLARSITRGQALFVLMKLQGISGDGVGLRYQDVSQGTLEAPAVSTAIRLGWMEPATTLQFGVRRVLKGEDAKKLLRKVAGEPEPTTTPNRYQRTTTTPQQITVTIRDPGTSTQRLPKAQILEAIWSYIGSNYLYDEKIDPDEAAYRAAEAIVESLGDPYTSFLRPAGISSLETQIEGIVTGIGAQVEQRHGILTIVSPLRSSPAEKAGLKPNDEILKADGVDLTDLSFMDAVDKVRGPKGSTVKLLIRREGREFEVNVIRDTVRVPEIEETWQDGVVTVQLMQFGKATENDLRSTMEEIQKKNPRGIILDLRSNPGGLLHAANIVVSNFVPSGTIVARIVSRDETRADETSASPTMRADIPMVVLVNEGSASASEIVAGALQDHGRATVVGTKTFGKGTVQQVVRFNDESGLKVTVAEWRTPNGRKIDGSGLQPDVIVQYDSDRDEQMVRALEILR